MVLRYWGERGLTAESFAHLVDRSAAGIRTDALLRELTAQGWMAVALDGTDEAIDAELQRGRPVLTLIEDRPGRFHYIVIVATTREAVIFHDPARAPLRVIGRAGVLTAMAGGTAVDGGGRPWRPQARGRAGFGRSTAPPAPGACSQLIASGVAQAQGRRRSCRRTQPDDRAFVRWSSRTARARRCQGAAAAMGRCRGAERHSHGIEPGEPYGWRLLGTSRFLQNNRAGALSAWNHSRRAAARPDDLSLVLRGHGSARLNVSVGIHPGSVITPALLTRSERRLRELPAAASAAVDIVPKPGGLAELLATVNERPLVPADVWSYAAIGAAAASRREIGVSTGSLTGGGERLGAEWRFWPGRPRVGLAMAAPAPWSGVWGVGAFYERERFTGDVVPVERSGGYVQWSNWVAPLVKFTIETGVEDWDQIRHPQPIAWRRCAF
jgi:hypothetical protein